MQVIIIESRSFSLRIQLNQVITLNERRCCLLNQQQDKYFRCQSVHGLFARVAIQPIVARVNSVRKTNAAFGMINVE